MGTEPERRPKKPTTEVKRPVEPSDGGRRAALRRTDYAQATAEEQWEDDKALGILDWDGS